MNILYNYAAHNASRINKNIQKQQAKTTGKLSSGYRINAASDDAASLAISEKMRAQIRGLGKAENNIEDGSSFCQVADGALGEVQEMLQRINELAIQASNDTNTEQDRKEINHEIQQIKMEIDDIFHNTEFNTRPIWDTITNDKVQVGSTKKQALTLSTTSKSIRLDETTKAAVAKNGYRINIKGTDESDPSTYGFTVSWTGYNNNNYETSLITWPPAGKNSFSVNIGDYVDKAAQPELNFLDYNIRWNTVDGCTLDDMAASLSGVSFSSSTNSSESVSITANGQSIGQYGNAYGISFSFSTDHLLELTSGRDAENYDTAWIEPQIAGGASSNVITHPSYTDTMENTGWQIQFKMANIGTVTATSSTVICSSGDRTEDTKGIWWHYTVINPYTGQTRKDGNSYVSSTGSTGSLNQVLACLKLPSDNDTSLAKVGGSINVTFQASGPAYSYCGTTSSSYYNFSLSMNISVSKNETAESIMDRISHVLNDSTVFDIYEGNSGNSQPSPMYGYIYSTSARQHLIESPEYMGVNTLMIQSGSKGHDGIPITYESMNSFSLGIHDTDLSTWQGAQDAIVQVTSALNKVSEQRSLFGAYMNRLENAGHVDANIQENTQRSESKLRDADIAEFAVENARNNILLQVSDSMISNSNHSLDTVLSLLQNE